MTCFTFSQLQDIWKSNGGSSLFAPMAAAIAMAESGGCSDATGHNSNGSVDRGLWQINSSNGALSTTDINGNARAAIQISNNGANWRPWCTAYSDGACGTKGGSFLGSGSPFQKFLSGDQIPAGQSQISTGQTASQTAGSTAQTIATKGCTDQLGSNCQIPLSPQLKIPFYTQTLGCFCLWEYGWSRAVIGGLMFAGAFALTIAGVFLVTTSNPTVKGAINSVTRVTARATKVGALVA